MVPKATEETHAVDVQVEENDESRLGTLFGVNQETEVDARLKTNVFLKNADQNNF